MKRDNRQFKIRNAWGATVLIGLVTIVISLILLPLFPTDSHVDLSGYGGPVFAFENADSLADLIAVFGPENDPGRASRIAQMDAGNIWDFPFMIAYSLFMAAFLTAAYLSSGNKIWLAAVAIALMSGVFDAIENVFLLGITDNLSAPPYLDILGIPVWGKFFSIMIGIAAAAVFIMRQKQMLWKPMGVVAFIGALTIIPAFVAASQYGWLVRHGVSAGWSIMLLFAVVQMFRRQPASLLR
jgi:hypothetical protein